MRLRALFGIFCAAVVGCTEPTAPVPVTSISILIDGENSTAHYMSRGDRKALVPVVLGEENRVLLNRRITWTSSDPSVVFVESTGMLFAPYVRDTVSRQATITASAGGQSASLSVWVFPSEPATAEGFASLTLAHGDSVTFVPIVKDGGGSVMPGQAVYYESSDPSIARMDGNVLTAGAHLGPSSRVARIAVKYISRELASFTVTVPPTTFDRIEIFAGNGFVPVGRSRQLRAFAVSPSGALINGAPPIAWTAAGTAATLSSDGVVTGIGDGTITVTASSGSRTASRTLTVNECGTGPAGAYPIEVRQIGFELDPAVARAFTCATARLRSVIVGALPPVQYTNAGDFMCNSGVLNETVPGLLIFTAVAPWDGVGGLVSQGGPCVLREGSNLPNLGMMRFDSVDLADLSSRGLLEDVIMHEMLHVLGFGTVWEQKALVGGHFHGMDWRWQGSFANAECRRDFVGKDVCATGVPVETCYRSVFLPGCTGLNRTHWHEYWLQDELMTGFLNSPRNPLSSMTIQSLADLGYQVDATQGDAFSFVPVPTSPSMRSLQPGVVMSAPLKPTGVVDRNGRITRLAR